MPSQATHLILVQLGQWFDELEPVSGRGIYSDLFQNVMLRLDSSLRLDPIRGNGPLDQVFTAQLVGLFLQYLIESLAKSCTLLFRRRLIRNRLEESARCMDESDLQGQGRTGQPVSNPLGLTGTHEPSIDQDWN